MSARPAAAASREPIGLECPRCDNDGSSAPLRFLASDAWSAEMVALHCGDTVDLAGPVARSEEVHPQLGCHACGHRFDVPTLVRGLTWGFEP